MSDQPNERHVILFCHDRLKSGDAFDCYAVTDDGYILANAVCARPQDMYADVYRANAQVYRDHFGTVKRRDESGVERTYDCPFDVIMLDEHETADYPALQEALALNKKLGRLGCNYQSAGFDVLKRDEEQRLPESKL